jgi:hypothetical protein
MIAPVDWAATGSMLSGLATLLAVVVAFVGVRIALQQIAANKAVAASADLAAREAAALAAWNGYLRLCFENPTYACADQARKVVPKGLLQLSKNPSPEAEKYQWFISIVLNSCEQVLQGMPDANEWRATLIDQVWYHAEAVNQLWNGGWDQHYSPEMSDIVRAGLKKGESDA